MIPISELTNAELDKLIAEKRGWKICDCNHCKKHNYHIWLDPKGGLNLEDCPSFTTDPRYAMELLEEMPKPSIVKNTDYWTVIPDIETPDEYMIVADNIDLKRAISEAYAQWKGEKC